MLYRRYGQVHFRDCAVSWIIMPLYFVCTFIGVCLDLQWWICVIPSFFGVVHLWTLLNSVFEKFSVRGNQIHIQRGMNSQIADVPTEILVIISVADIRPWGATRTNYREQTHILTGQFALSILRNTTVQEAIERLHRPPLKPYTTSMIEDLFEEYRFVYSFVYEQAVTSDILDGREYQIIIPESLANQMPASLLTTDVFIDKGY